METETLPIDITRNDQIILYHYFVRKILSAPSQEAFEIALEQNKSVEDAIVEAVRNEAIIMVLKETIKGSKKKKHKTKKKK
jgi:hypothetical protein